MLSFVLSVVWWIVGGVLGSWLLYVLAMGAKERREAIKARSKLAYYTLYTIAFAGYLWDILLNLTVCTIVFFDWPRELTITYRLRRYIKTDFGWRYSVADWACTHMLEIMDTDHCGRN